MKTSLKLLASSALIAAICGCTTVPDSQKEYNPQWSRAKNIVDLFDFEAINDEGNLNVVSSALEVRRSLGKIIYPDILVHSIGKAFIGGITDDAPADKVASSSERYGFINGDKVTHGDELMHYRDHAFGYVPVSVAKTPKEARDYFVKSVVDSFKKASDYLKIPMKMIHDGDGEYEDKFLKKYGPTTSFNWNGKYVYSHANISWIDKSKGCLYWKDAKLSGQTCRFNVYAMDPEPAEMTPSFLGDGSIMAWKITSSSSWPTILIDEGEQKTVDYYKLAVAASKYLPEFIYVYLAPRNNKNPSLLIEKGKVNYFVSPKKD